MKAISLVIFDPPIFTEYFVANFANRIIDATISWKKYFNLY